MSAFVWIHNTLTFEHTCTCHTYHTHNTCHTYLSCHTPQSHEHVLCNCYFRAVRGLYIAMVQYSSLCEGATVVSLGVIDIGDGVPSRVQVECGREEVNDGENQEKDRTKKQPMDDLTHIMDDMKMEWMHNTDTLGSSSWAMQWVCTVW